MPTWLKIEHPSDVAVILGLLLLAFVFLLLLDIKNTLNKIRELLEEANEADPRISHQRDQNRASARKIIRRLQYPRNNHTTPQSGAHHPADVRYNARMKVHVAALAVLLPAFAAPTDAIHGNAFGDPKAPITIEVFSDFQCPACKRFHDEQVPLIVKDYVSAGKVYLVYRYFPLPQHPYGRKAAELVCACAQLGKYEPAADILFAKQAAWSQDGKLDETLAAVLTPTERKKVDELVKDPSVQDPINHDVAEGRALPLASTPTVLITSKSKQFKLQGQGLFNYTWVKATLDDLLK
ncbi:MAG TPA: thioredoxin domain-containing protein [Bryobacteraceae bacterium]|jgi:protein-disulfide isomerase|nr:thioredoxin domain-containing protein [Bryobacteraceae bacterium]